MHPARSSSSRRGAGHEQLELAVGLSAETGGDEATTGVGVVPASEARNLAESGRTPPVTQAQSIVDNGLKGGRALAASVRPQDQLRLARATVCATVSAYWRMLQAAPGRNWPLHELPSEIDLSSLSEEAGELARSVGRAAAGLDVADAHYRIGLLYTAMMPARLRTRLGAYYTPPALCERLLDMATAGGVDWRTARVLDPACGGGAFLSPVARRMAGSLKDCSARIAVRNIQSRLRGLELDPFAAWMSRVFLDVTLGDLCDQAGERPQSVVRVCDSLGQMPDEEQFDLVVGNPPYGRVTLSPERREKFKRSLFGHANLYGVFTDLALRFVRPGGVIAYVTPTSFLSGEYFKALRSLLAREAPPASIDFIGERKGVFADVLQETLLAAYRRNGSPSASRVHFIMAAPDGSIKPTAAGSFRLPTPPDRPWLMARRDGQTALAGRVVGMPCRLADYGYTVSTGPLVWNRHKASLRDEPGKGRYPLVWAESVRPDGTFVFRAQKHNHRPYFEPGAGEHWVLTDFPCTLLQRTTAKEQRRRLIAAELPQSFIRKHGAVVVENHLNMIKPLKSAPKVSPAALTALLNSSVVDQVFRCISGTVAVSAYELRALPVPSPEDMQEIDSLIKMNANREILETALERLYNNGGAA